MTKWDKKHSVEGDWTQIVTEDTGSSKREGQDTGLVVLEKEHQRFYDRLRKKVEEFLGKQTGQHAETAAKYILLAPDLFVLFARLLQDKRVSVKSKAIAGAVVAYFISPLDFIPEVIVGPIGFLDDILLAAYALSKIIHGVDKAVVLEHWNGKADLLDLIQELLKKAEDLVDSKVLGKIKKFFK